MFSSMCVCMSVYTVCVCICLDASGSLPQLLFCSLGVVSVFEVKVDVVVVVDDVVLEVVKSERRLSEVPWNLVWSQFLLFLLSPHVPASSVITCGVVLVFVSV